MAVIRPSVDFFLIEYINEKEEKKEERRSFVDIYSSELCVTLVQINEDPFFYLNVGYLYYLTVTCYSITLDPVITILISLIFPLV